MQRAHRALFSTTVAQAVTTRGIAFDDDAQDFLDNIELKRSWRSITKRLKRKIDILGMDACLMSMAEVAYQTARHAPTSRVGSQEEEPGDGWPYDRILKALATKPAMSPRDLSKRHRPRVPASPTAPHEASPSRRWSSAASPR